MSARWCLGQRRNCIPSDRGSEWNSIQSPALALILLIIPFNVFLGSPFAFPSISLLGARNTTQNHQFTHFLFFSKKQTSKEKQKNRKITLNNKAGRHRQKKASSKKKRVFGEKRKALQKWGNKRRRKWSKSPFGCRTTRRRVLLVEIINVLLRFIASNVSWNAREPNWIRKLTHEEESQRKPQEPSLACPRRLMFSLELSKSLLHV